MNLRFVTFPVGEISLSKEADLPLLKKKQLANSLVTKAKSQGELKVELCCVCGDAKVDAHHEDYDRPNVVAFLCRRHHVERHRELGWGFPRQTNANAGHEPQPVTDLYVVSAKMLRERIGCERHTLANYQTNKLIPHGKRRPGVRGKFFTAAQANLLLSRLGSPAERF